MTFIPKNTELSGRPCGVLCFTCTCGENNPFMEHKLLPARTPQGALVEDLIKNIYQHYKDKNLVKAGLVWCQIEQIAKSEAARALQESLRE